MHKENEKTVFPAMEERLKTVTAQGSLALLAMGEEGIKKLKALRLEKQKMAKK